MTESNSDNALTAAVAEIEQLCADKQRLLASLHDALQRAHTAEEQRDTYDAARVELQETLAERNRELATARRELDEARAELERERVRLAGCGVAALDGSPEQEVQPEGYGWSASYGDVLKLRRDHDRALRDLAAAREVVEAARAFATRQPITEHMVLCLREALAALDRAQGKDAGGSGAAVAAVASGPLTTETPEPAGDSTKGGDADECDQECSLPRRSEVARPADCTSAAAPDPEAPATRREVERSVGRMVLGGYDTTVPKPHVLSLTLTSRPDVREQATRLRDSITAWLSDGRRITMFLFGELVQTPHDDGAIDPPPLTESDVERIARRVALDTVADVCERADKNARAEWPWPLSRLGEVCRALAAELTGG